MFLDFSIYRYCKLKKVLNINTIILVVQMIWMLLKFSNMLRDFKSKDHDSSVNERWSRLALIRIVGETCGRNCCWYIHDYYPLINILPRFFHDTITM